MVCPPGPYGTGGVVGTAAGVLLLLLCVGVGVGVGVVGVGVGVGVVGVGGVGRRLGRAVTLEEGA